MKPKKEGEKQRISIARSILKNAPIIVLDEATASIDSDNESYIQEAIDALVNGKILLVIAHRLNTIKNANQILVLDEGKITEHGTHEELIIQEESVDLEAGKLFKEIMRFRNEAEQYQNRNNETNINSQNKAPKKHGKKK